MKRRVSKFRLGTCLRTLREPHFKVLRFFLSIGSGIEELTAETIVSRGERVGKGANIKDKKVENNGAVVYVGSSLTVHNPFFFCSQIVTE